jgi:hypothetical protein
MKEEAFKELVESIKEAGAVMRGERKPSRVFKYPPQLFGAPEMSAAPSPFEDDTPQDAENQQREPETQEAFAICIATDDPELLQVRKLYRAEPLPDGLLSVIDEEGEAAIYPADHFIVVRFSRDVEEILSRVA